LQIPQSPSVTTGDLGDDIPVALASIRLEADSISALLPPIMERYEVAV